MLASKPLRSATFRHLAAAYWVNEFGNWIGEIALTLLVYDRTHSPLATAGLFLALRFLPALTAPLLTVRVEAVGARAALTTLYLVEAILFAGIAWLTRHFSLGAVLALGGVDGLLAITAKALSRGAAADELTKNGLLREGNGILNLGMMASTAGAPVIAGALVAWKGAASALVLDAATFLLTAAIVCSAPRLRAGSSERDFRVRLGNVSTLLNDSPALRRLLVAIALVMGFGAIPIPVEVVFARHTLHAGASGYGLLLGSWGLGMVLGGAGFVAGRGIQLYRLIMVGTLLTAFGYGGLAASPTLAVSCVFSGIGGFGNGVAWVAAVTAVQERATSATQSAVMSLLEGVNQVVPALGFVAGGAIAAAFSPRWAYAAAAAAMSGVVLTSAYRWPRADTSTDQQSDEQRSDRDRNAAAAGADPQEKDATARRVAGPTL